MTNIKKCFTYLSGEGVRYSPGGGRGDVGSRFEHGGANNEAPRCACAPLRRECEGSAPVDVPTELHLFGIKFVEVSRCFKYDIVIDI